MHKLGIASKIGIPRRLYPSHAEATMPLEIVTTSSISQTDLQAWTRVCGADDLLMHPGFLEAAEASMRAGTVGAKACGCDTHFWYLLAYSDGEPVGAACVTEYPLDTMVFAAPFSQWLVGHVRRIIPNYLKFRVTFCGLPISTAGSNVRVVAGVDPSSVVRALNAAVEQIARQRKTWLIVYKEFTDGEVESFAALHGAGYVQGESLPMNRIVNRFRSFSAMLGEMRSHYRYKISRSRKKFAQSNLRLERTTGLAAIEPIYTPALHAMYERVTLRAEHRLEILPREYFLELAARFPDGLILTTIRDGDKVLAFAWSLRHGSEYHNLFVGIDYERNEESDAYFNLMTEDIAHALDGGVEEVLVGQTADEFKSRLGCTSDPRWLLIKVTSPAVHWIFRKLQSQFFTPLPPTTDRDVFKHETTATALSLPVPIVETANVAVSDS
jgi:predicted N-acyltransferase